jgi:hypothetical protein
MPEMNPFSRFGWTDDRYQRFLLTCPSPFASLTSGATNGSPAVATLSPPFEWLGEPEERDEREEARRRARLAFWGSNPSTMAPDLVEWMRQQLLQIDESDPYSERETNP